MDGGVEFLHAGERAGRFEGIAFVGLQAFLFVFAAEGDEP